jgi:galactose mutarotase-like enzyme
VLGEPPGPVLHLLTLGATMHRLEVAGGDGRRRNVLLGHPDVATYLESSAFIGGTIGRYANRIAAGRFDLDGQTVRVEVNDRGNALHGGREGFDKRIWEVVSSDATRAVLRLTSPDGDMGFPGTVTATAAFDVGESSVQLTLEAVTDAPTVVNLTSHAYWNLDGAGTIGDHRLTVPAGHWTPVDATGIPTGGHEPVDDTPYDLREPTLLFGHDYDHNFVVDGTGRRVVALLESAASSTRMEMWSDQPGLQVYSGAYFDGTSRDVLNRPIERYAGVALEPQLFPDSPNHPEWPSPRLAPGETYRSTIEWRFDQVG